MNLVIQLIGGLGVVASIISFQCKKHSSILFFRTLNEFIFAIQYFLLGAYTGMSMNLVGCIRNIIFINQVKNNKKTIVSSTIFCIMFFVFGLVSWQGKKSILIIFAKILSTIAYGNKNTTVVRIIIFLTSTSWLIYNYCIFSIAGIICEAFTLVSLIVGIIRFNIIPLLSKADWLICRGLQKQQIVSIVLLPFYKNLIFL